MVCQAEIKQSYRACRKGFVMDRKNYMAIDIWKYFLLVVIVGALLLLLYLHPRQGTDYDREMVEVVIVEKEISEMDGKEIYLIHGEDRNGVQKTFQITNAALSERFEESKVFKEIKTGKYYKFKVADEETYESYYPSICGAVKLIKGFSPESSDQ